jgi:hypothetical protein
MKKNTTREPAAKKHGLDERDHKNDSFAFCGETEYIVKYKGTPVNNHCTLR